MLVVPSLVYRFYLFIYVVNIFIFFRRSLSSLQPELILRMNTCRAFLEKRIK
jgi:hypothetical protein